MNTTLEQREEWLRRARLTDNGSDAKTIDIPAYVLVGILEDFARSERPADPAPDAVREKLREALQDCAENLAFALAKLGVCGEGDGKDHRADAEVPGGLDTLKRARAALKESAGKGE